MIEAKRETPDDIALLGRIARREPEGLSLLYDRHSGVAFSLAYRLLHERSAAEDIVYAAFLKVWQSPTTYDARRGEVRIWLLTIVLTQAVPVLRARHGDLIWSPPRAS